jgi:hypothetical protein
VATEREESTCPDCGRKVGARATHCMHCGAEWECDGSRREETDSRGESLLARLRPGSASGRSDAATTATTERASAVRETTEPTRETPRSHGDDRGTDETTGSTDGAVRRTAASAGGTAGELRAWIPDSWRYRAAAVAVPAAVLAFGASLTVPGTAAALAGWVLFSLVALASRPTTDALPGVLAGFVLFALFVPAGVVGLGQGGFGAAAGLLLLLVALGYALWNTLVA